MIKLKYVVDTFKWLTVFIQFYIMYFYNSTWNINMWIYISLHGTYGILWGLKSIYFGDKSWEAIPSFWFGFYVFGGLILYWAPGYIIASHSIVAPYWLIYISITMFTFGVFFHFVSDMQKTIEIELRPRTLIKDKLWSISRNPNYFGELLIYCGFNMLSMHWFPFAVLLLGIITVWIPNMRLKDKSLSKYKEFEEYKKKTSLFIPYIY